MAQYCHWVTNHACVLIIYVVLCLCVQDSVCGSAHCALAQYWCNQLGKCDFVAYSVLQL